VLEPRQERILLAVIREYIESAEPVGSAVLCQKYNLECSPATIRAEMGRLEEMGYLAQPHTSAGRVPLDRAYRHYVDRLLRERIQPPPEASSIAREFLDPHIELEELIEHTTHLLSHLTRYTSVVLGPRLGRSLFKYLQLVPVAPRQILLVMMTHAGGIVHKVVEVSHPVDAEQLARITNMLNDRLPGLSLEALNRGLQELPEPLEPEIALRLSEATRELTREFESRAFYEGVSRLLEQPEFRDAQKARALIEIIEEERLLVEIMERSLSSKGLAVVIGTENRVSEMREFTVVTATYTVDGVAVGSLGVLGPTRLSYERVIPIVCYVADRLGSRLSRAE
jgi:heat-inducible transcriptional repressor